MIKILKIILDYGINMLYVTDNMFEQYNYNDHFGAFFKIYFFRSILLPITLTALMPVLTTGGT